MLSDISPGICSCFCMVQTLKEKNINTLVKWDLVRNKLGIWRWGVAIGLYLPLCLYSGTLKLEAFLLPRNFLFFRVKFCPFHSEGLANETAMMHNQQGLQFQVCFSVRQSHCTHSIVFDSPQIRPWSLSFPGAANRKLCEYVSNKRSVL
jgi:hypothetical protein